jgi:hypothetical protein
MSKQHENEMQQPLTPQELHQTLLHERETSHQSTAPLHEEQLEMINGGGNMLSGIKATYQVHTDLGEHPVLSAVSALIDGPLHGIKLAEQRITDSEAMRVMMRNSTMDHFVQENLKKYTESDKALRKGRLKRSHSF